MDWFLYDRDLHHERVKCQGSEIVDCMNKADYIFENNKDLHLIKFYHRRIQNPVKHINWKQITISVKSSILDCIVASEYDSGLCSRLTHTEWSYLSNCYYQLPEWLGANACNFALLSKLYKDRFCTKVFQHIQYPSTWNHFLDKRSFDFPINLSKF